MANQEQLDLLRQGIETWNQWRKENPNIQPDLSGADLSRIDLNGNSLISLSGTDAPLEEYLTKANLSRANMTRTILNLADLSGADLRGANLSWSWLKGANLGGSNLNGAIFQEALLAEVNLSRAELGGTDLSEALIMLTTFGDVDLSTVKGLETVNHRGPSYIDFHTLVRSQGNIAEAFLKGVGLSDTFISYIRSLIGKPIDYYSCFISYSSKNEDFAKRLYADLQSNGVRCWFAPHDLLRFVGINGKNERNILQFIDGTLSFTEEV